MSAPSDVSNQFYGVSDDAVAGYGAQLFVADQSSPETFEAIAGVKSIPIPTQQTTDIDVTHLRSPNRHKEHKAGMRDTGQIQVEMVYMPTHRSQSMTGGGTGPFQYGGLPVLQADGVNRSFKIVCNDDNATTILFRAYIGAFSPGTVGYDGTIPATLTLQPVQAPTLP